MGLIILLANRNFLVIYFVQLLRFRGLNDPLWLRSCSLFSDFRSLDTQFTGNFLMRYEVSNFARFAHHYFSLSSFFVTLHAA